MSDQHDNTDQNYITVLITASDGTQREVTFKAKTSGEETIGDVMEHMPEHIRRAIEDADENAIGRMPEVDVPHMPSAILPTTGEDQAACPWCGKPITLHRG